MQRAAVQEPEGVPPGRRAARDLEPVGVPETDILGETVIACSASHDSEEEAVLEAEGKIHVPCLEDPEKDERLHFNPWRDAVPQGEELVANAESYKMLHYLETSWPCLSLDAIPTKSDDGINILQGKWPMELLIIGGTQAEKADLNAIYIFKSSNLQCTALDDIDSDDDVPKHLQSFERCSGQPKVGMRLIPHKGSVNRVAVHPHLPRLVAALAEDGSVRLYDIQGHIDHLSGVKGGERPCMTAKFLLDSSNGGLECEGFALTWNPTKDTPLSGSFLCGSTDGTIRLVEAGAGFSFRGSPLSFQNSESIESLAWKVCGDGAGEIFASGGSGGEIILWNAKNGDKLKTIQTSGGDVNALAFAVTKKSGNLLISGSEDGSIVVWDTAALLGGQQSLAETARFKMHNDAITRLAWDPMEDCQFASASYDNTVAIWDLSLEVGEDAPADTPNELLFVHCCKGQVSDLAFSPNARTTLLISTDTAIEIAQPNLD